MSMRVCIPTAGTGSRLGPLTHYLNKSLVSLANRPILSHVIEQFPKECEFVIALGYKGHLVREYLELAHPDRVFLYADVSPYEGPESGLGLSLLACKEHLQQPFIFISCDTLVREPLPRSNKNWMAYAERTDIAQYRTLLVEEGMVCAICEKGEGRIPSHKPYIGLAQIMDYALFWEAMESGGKTAIDTGEAHGLRHLLTKAEVEAHAFTWLDTGNPRALAEAREAYREEDAPVILEKANEAIWFVGDQVIKFSNDPSFIANRVKRAKEIAEFVPAISGTTTHMYRYAKAKGKVISEVVTLPLFDKLLEHSSCFWKKASLKAEETSAFRQQCMAFYKQKTFERVALFYQNFERADTAARVNGIAMPSLQSLLENLPWEWLAEGLPGHFHGDFIFENILWSEETNRFTFLDWRQDFGGSLTVGDIYYDLAKLLHGLIINHQLIAQEQFHVTWEGESLTFDFHRKYMLIECENYLTEWLEENGYDARKVRMLTGLIFLNIAALHHYPYSLLLYGLGKTMIFEETDFHAGH